MHYEEIFYCTSPVKVQKTIFIRDVYKEILHYEEEGLFKISGFNDATKEVQAERWRKEKIGGFSYGTK